MSARPFPLPSVDRVLNWMPVQGLQDSHGRSAVVDAVRTVLSDLRARLKAGTLVESELEEATVRARVEALLTARQQSNLRRVFNLTGTVLHTNLGRALLAERAIEQVAMTMRDACTVEYDIAVGARGERDDAIETLLCELTGAEAATVVNNNAAAVLLTLAALAGGREVLLSRGELVEIGGAFRIPDVMRSAGCTLVEVGTTNRTHEKDYLSAITPASALLMKVYASNYVIQGFTAAVPETRLAAIAHAAALPFAVDLGSGSLIDLTRYGLPHEPLARDTLLAGADVVTFSGDKLLGGPQAGLIVGSKACIDRIRSHPLKRALRVSKLVMAALEATLRLYRHPEQLTTRLPTLRLLTRPTADIAQLAMGLLPAAQQAVAPRYSARIVDVSSQIGSGSLPLDLLPSAALGFYVAGPTASPGRALEALATALRSLPIPVIGRVREDQLLLDLRCLEDERGFRAQLPALAQRLG